MAVFIKTLVIACLEGVHRLNLQYNFTGFGKRQNHIGANKKVGHLTLRLELAEKEIKQLRRENNDLKARLAKYEHPKNSGYSSIPPSKDQNRIGNFSLAGFFCGYN